MKYFMQDELMLVCFNVFLHKYPKAARKRRIVTKWINRFDLRGTGFSFRGMGM